MQRGEARQSLAIRCDENQSPIFVGTENFSSEPKEGIEDTGEFSRIALRITNHNCGSLLGN
jgi:hypothetical protein